MSTFSKVTLHNDGTITFWSVYSQNWCRCAQVGDRELAAMSERDRAKCIKHMARTDRRIYGC